MTKKTSQTRASPKVEARQGRTEIALRVVLQQPPPGVDFALQKGRGSIYETVQKQRPKGGDLKFAFSIAAKAAKDGSADFAGPFVQGPCGARFVYLDIGTYAGQSNTPWSRRLKVPLAGIDWKLIQKAEQRAGAIIETSVNGTGKDGGPACATVRPPPIWKVK